MLKSITALVALFTIFSAGNLTAVAEKKEATMDAIYVPVGRLALAPPVGVISKRSVVAFPHSQHFSYTCRTCHHKWDGKTQVKSCTVSQCHDQLSSPLKMKTMSDYGSDSNRYYKYAFHEQCIGCHKGIKTHNVKMERSRKRLKEPLQTTGPTGCVGCHPRE